jgi:CBS domain containing-hemolysin-like protein
LDSGSTALTILLAASVLGFIGLHGASAAMPLLRRSAVRDSVGERGVREAAVRRLRTGRYAYEELIALLLLLSAGSATASALALITHALDLHWALVFLLICILWVLLLLLAPLAEHVTRRLPASTLVTFGTIAQACLWPLLPVRRFSRSGLRLAGAEEPDQGANGHANGADEGPVVEEEIEQETLERHEREMIHAILHLDQTPVREIMVPRIDVVAVDVATSVDRAVARILDSGHSRLPVYNGATDNIVGILYSRDLLAAVNGVSQPSLQDLVRPAFFVPESKRIDDLLSEFKQRRIHMAVVVDEYGVVSGIVTVEDLLEEIVGEIEDEFDKGQPDIQWLSDDAALIDARMPVDDFSETFSVAVEADGFDTVGGLLFTRLGKVPAVGDRVVESGLELRVMTTIGRRVKRVKVGPASVDAAGA